MNIFVYLGVHRCIYWFMHAMLHASIHIYIIYIYSDISIFLDLAICLPTPLFSSIFPDLYYLSLCTSMYVLVSLSLNVHAIFS